MAISVTPGQRLTRDEWEALFQQHGLAKANAYPVNVSASKPLKDQVLSGEDQRPVYRYYATDGTYVEARTADNGEDFEIVSYKPSKQAEQAAGTDQNTPAAREAARLEAERARNRSLPPDQDPRDETDAQRAARADATRKEQEAKAEATRKEQEAKAERERKEAEAAAARPPQERVNPADPTKRQVWNPTSKAWEDAGAVAQKPDKPDPGQLVTGGDGKKYRVRVGPNNETIVEETAVPAEVKPPQNVIKRGDDGRDYVLSVDAQGNGISRPVEGSSGGRPKPRERMKDPAGGPDLELQDDGTWTPIKVEGRPEAPDIPALRGEFGSIATELSELSRQLEAEVGAGRLTPDRATSIFNARHAAATTRVNEIKTIVDSARGIYGDQVAQRGQSLADEANRRSTAASTYATATGAFNNLFDKPMPGAGQYASAAFEQLLGMARKHAEASGAPAQQRPEIAMPRSAQQILEMELPGGIRFSVNSPGGGDGGGGAAAQPVITPGNLPDPTQIGPAVPDSGGAGPSPDLVPPSADNAAIGTQYDVEKTVGMLADPDDDEWNSALTTAAKRFGFAA